MHPSKPGFYVGKCAGALPGGRQHALVGEPDQAITLMERLLSAPGPVAYSDFPNNMTLADLRLRWEWDPLRSDPRVQKILAGSEPKIVLTR